MPVLKNAKHEKLALALADGKSQEAAYVEAGYSMKGASAAAARLLQQNISIHQRRDEILAERDQARKDAESSAAVRVVADRNWLVDKAVQLVERGMQSAPVTNAKGEPVVIVSDDGEVRPMYGFNDRAVAAGLRIIGLAQGHFVMRHRREDDPLSQLSPEVTRAINQRLLVALQNPGQNVVPISGFLPAGAASQPREPVTLENDNGSELGGQPTARRKARTARAN